MKIGVLFIVALVAAALPSLAQAAPSSYVVAASQVRTEVDLDRVECVSLVENGTVIFKKAFFHDRKIIEIIEALWSGKRAASDDSQCPYVLSFNILSVTTHAVHYRGVSSKVLMSFQVCGRQPNGRPDPDHCTYKNLYLFERNVRPLEAFEIALKAFLRAQEERWVVMNVSMEGLGGER